MSRVFDPSARARRRQDPGVELRGQVVAAMAEDVATVGAHWAAIADMAEGRRVPAGAGERGGSSTTADGNELFQQRQAFTWLGELDKVRADLARVAQRALIVDPPAPKSRRTGDELDVCVGCGQEIVPGAADGKCHRVDGRPLHASSCYYRAHREAQRRGVTLGSVVAELASGRANAQTGVSAAC